MSFRSEPIRILHVDDDPAFADATAEYLQRDDDPFEIHTASAPEEGMDLLDSNDVDCVISDCEMPRTNGIQFLEAVREEYPDLPFILFTGNGSEEIAAEAIERGVTSYLQKERGAAQYAMLRNRIETHVEQYRATREAARLREEHELVAEVATDAFWVLDPGNDKLLLDGLTTFGYEDYEETREWWAERLHPDDRERILDRDEALLEGDVTALDERTGERGWFTNEYRWRRADGSYADCTERGIVLFEGETPRKMIGTITDVTERKERQEELIRQNERLEEFAGVISHDLRNPLNVASTRLELLADECDSSHTDSIREAHGRMERIIDDVLWLARQGQKIGSTEPVDLHGAIESAWTIVADDSEGPDLVVPADDNLPDIVADGDRLRQLLENLLRNAVEHGGEDVTVTVGGLADGFYVEDDGPGVPAEDHESVFEAGYSTDPDGTGLGLSIVEQVAEAHGWEIRVTGADAGGARFEITGVESPPEQRG